jgi:TrmH family RNA methyltransferase
MDTITSTQNPRVKLVYGLQNRPRTRRKERKIALEGVRLLSDAVERGYKPEFVFYEPGSADYDLIARLQERGFELLPVNTEVMAHMSATDHPAGVLGVFPLPVPHLPRKPAPRRVLILDNVRDPGNLGTILRTAAAAGVQVAILSPGCADPYNPKALRGGMGAHFRLPVVEATWEEIAGYCAPLKVYLADGAGQTDYDTVDWTAAWALVIGSEAHGLSAEATALSEQRVRIPMAAHTESLNAAMAAAVILFEAGRQARAARAQG